MSFAMIDKYPQMKCSVFDLPEVVAITEELFLKPEYPNVEFVGGKFYQPLYQ